MHRAAVVEACPDPELTAHCNFVANTLELLGFQVVRWKRTQPLPRCLVVFWWGDNQGGTLPDQVRRIGCKPYFMEWGFLSDRKESLQLDPVGINGLASWARSSELIARLNSGVGPEYIRPGRGNHLLVVLRYEDCHLRHSEIRSPFVNNADWLLHLAQYSRLPLVCRIHPRCKKQEQTRKFIEQNGWRVSSAPTFEEAAMNSKAVAVIDSTAGYHALELGMPVLLYGELIGRWSFAYETMMVGEMQNTSKVTASLLEGTSSIRRGSVKLLLSLLRSHQWSLRDQSGFKQYLNTQLLWTGTHS